MSAISQAERDAIMKAALALGAALKAVRHVENRDIAMADSIDIIAQASESDGYSALANCAVEIRVQAEKNIYDAEETPEQMREYERKTAEIREMARLDACSRRATA